MAAVARWSEGRRALRWAVFAAVLIGSSSVLHLNARGDSQSDPGKRPTRRAGPARTPTPTRVPSGTWGGDHLRLEVGEARSQIVYDCARGEITGPLDLSKGRFDNTGTFLRTGPGSTAANRSPEPRPARYQGTVSGKRLTLTVTLTDRSQQIGTFSLTQDREGRLWKCE